MKKVETDNEGQSQFRYLVTPRKTMERFHFTIKREKKSWRKRVSEREKERVREGGEARERERERNLRVQFSHSVVFTFHPFSAN